MMPFALQEFKVVILMKKQTTIVDLFWLGKPEQVVLASANEKCR